jgi:hypothetical protein
MLRKRDFVSVDVLVPRFLLSVLFILLYRRICDLVSAHFPSSKIMFPK